MKKIILISFMLLSCAKHHQNSEAEVVDVLKIAKEVKIPKTIMSNLVKNIQAESKTVTPVFLFMPLEVQFIEDTPGVLRAPNLVYKFPKGGGEIDLQDITLGSGSYFMRFTPEQFENMSEFKPELLHLFFISNSPKTKIENEEYGLGCGRMIDLKKSFDKLQKVNFLKLNTTDQRHLFVSAGRYVFIFKQSTKVFVTQLTLTDSKYGSDLCLGEKF